MRVPATIVVCAFSQVPCDSFVSVDPTHTSRCSIWRNLEEHKDFISSSRSTSVMGMCRLFTCGSCASVCVWRGRCSGPNSSSAGAAHVSAVDVEIKALLQELQLLLPGVFLLQSPQSPDMR